MIDVHELIADPDFCQPSGVHVIRRVTEVVNHRNTQSRETLTMQGIITIGKSDSTQMRNEANENTEYINVFTNAPLFLVGTVDGVEHLSDLVVFEGKEYEVTEITNNGQYGFYKSVAVSLSKG